MNLKAYLIYRKNQTAEITEFLKHSDGCTYTTFPVFEPELVELIGAENLFDVPKAEKILKRSPKIQEISQTLSHIECWKEIINDNNIAENDLVLITEPTITLSKNYFSVLMEEINGFLHSAEHYNIALLQRSDDDQYWNDNIYAGEGKISSLVYSSPDNYNDAKCVMYLIRKSFIRNKLSELNSSKPYWLSTQFSEICDFKQIVHLSKLLARSNHLDFKKFKRQEKPIFSVIVPIYNVEKYLNQAIDSILSQDFYNYEIILVNDGSTDKSLEICLEYSKKYPHITLVNKANGGLSDARNYGIRIAKGKYLMFLDSDDYWRYNNTFSELANLIEDNPVDLIITYIASLTGSKITEHIIPAEKLTGDYDKDIYELISTKIYMGYSFIKVIKRDIIIDNNIYFPEGLYYEDIYWSYFLAKTIRSYLLYKTPYYMYRRDRIGSISEYLTTKKVKDMMEIFNTFYNDLKSNPIHNNVYSGIKLFALNFGDFIEQCYGIIYQHEKDEIRQEFEHFMLCLDAVKNLN